MTLSRFQYLEAVVAYHRAQSQKSGFWEQGADHVEGSYDAIVRTAEELLKAVGETFRGGSVPPPRRPDTPNPKEV